MPSADELTTPEILQRALERMRLSKDIFPPTDSGNPALSEIVGYAGNERLCFSLLLRILGIHLSHGAWQSIGRTHMADGTLAFCDIPYSCETIWTSIVKRMKEVGQSNSYLTDCVLEKCARHSHWMDDTAEAVMMALGFSESMLAYLRELDYLWSKEAIINMLLQKYLCPACCNSETSSEKRTVRYLAKL